MHIQVRVDVDVGRQSWEQSPLLTLQALVPSWSAEVGERKDLGVDLTCSGTGGGSLPSSWTSWRSPPAQLLGLLSPDPHQNDCQHRGGLGEEGLEEPCEW